MTCNTGVAFPTPDPGETLAHCASVLAVHVQFEAVVRLNAKVPPLDVTCAGTPEALVLQVDGLSDGEGAVGEDGVPLSPLSLPHAIISNNSVKGTSRPKADRIIAR